MKKRLSLLSLVVCFMVVALFAGCSSKEQSKTPATQTPAAQTKAPSSESFVLKLGHADAMEHPSTPGIKKMAESIKAKSGGRLVINDFPNSQLGGNPQLADAVSNGTLDMATGGAGELGKREKSILILDGPYLIRDIDHLQKIVNGPTGQEMWDKLAASTSIRVIGGYYYGTRYLTTGKLEVKTPADMKGFKLRVPNTQTSIAMAKAMGASPTPIDVGEVYLALSQGVANGQENPVPTILAQKFNEVQKYLILTGHQKPTQLIYINDKKLKSLPADLQKILLDEVKQASLDLSNNIQEVEKKQLEDIKAKGQMTVIQPNVEAFKEAEKAVYKELENVWGAGLYEKIQAVK